MSLKINVRESGSVVILDLDGRITLGETAASLRDTIRELLDSEPGGSPRNDFELCAR